MVSPDVGGGFGLKGSPFPDDCVTLWASKKLGRPVKWLATRTESLAHPTRHGREMVMYGEMALDENGKIRASAPRRCIRGRRLLCRPGSGPGRIRTAGASCRRPTTSRRCTVMVPGRLLTNTSPVGPYRGAGRPEVAYFTERMIDAAASAAAAATPDPTAATTATPAAAAGKASGAASGPTPPATAGAATPAAPAVTTPGPTKTAAGHSPR